jgi:probable rRNA maturation factor
MTDTDDQDDQATSSDRRGRTLKITVTEAPDDMAPSIRKTARRALQSQGFRHGRLDIAVLGDAEMRRQHARWSGEDSTTDSLAFDLRDESVHGLVDGQLLVCKSMARRRARSRKSDWRAELLLYVVHGCLHLCGYDDHDAAGATRMHMEEDRLLTGMGWGPVFRAAGCRSAAGSVSRSCRGKTR